MYKDLLENKTVVVVGRAAYLLDNPYMENQAEFIDGHDIVVRINNPLPYPYTTKALMLANDRGHFIDPNCHNVLGKKTDVFFVSKRPLIRFTNWFDAFVKSGGKAVANNRFIFRKYYSDPNRFTSCEYKSISNKISEVCYHHEVSRLVYFQFSELCYLTGGIKTTIDSEGNQKNKQMLATTGHLAIWEILSYNIKQVSMIGFTQYISDHPVDQQNYQIIKDHPFHSVDHGLLMFRIKAEEDCRLKPDAMLLSLFDRKKDMLDQLENELNERKKQWYQ